MKSIGQVLLHIAATTVLAFLGIIAIVGVISFLAWDIYPLQSLLSDMDSPKFWVVFRLIILMSTVGSVLTYSSKAQNSPSEVSKKKT